MYQLVTNARPRMMTSKLPMTEYHNPHSPFDATGPTVTLQTPAMNQTPADSPLSSMELQSIAVTTGVCARIYEPRYLSTFYFIYYESKSSILYRLLFFMLLHLNPMLFMISTLLSTNTLLNTLINLAKHIIAHDFTWYQSGLSIQPAHIKDTKYGRPRLEQGRTRDRTSYCSNPDRPKGRRGGRSSVRAHYPTEIFVLGHTFTSGSGPAISYKKLIIHVLIEDQSSELCFRFKTTSFASLLHLLHKTKPPSVIGDEGHQHVLILDASGTLQRRVAPHLQHILESITSAFPPKIKP
ncbi:hypothetical protein ZOSMA_52G00140 [Zostera marina]|uniref:Uncharacterized protein n=1 Tax=Zostera marina TaxID=29655 RepID=A0A0K9NXF0_ZOSMR|nr:hypothetical protein ZOSMA_52G00140 [Zostera marina]